MKIWEPLLYQDYILLQTLLLNSKFVIDFKAFKLWSTYICVYTKWFKNPDKSSIIGIMEDICVVEWILIKCMEQLISFFALHRWSNSKSYSIWKIEYPIISITRYLIHSVNKHTNTHTYCTTTVLVIATTYILGVCIIYILAQLYLCIIIFTKIKLL